MSKMKKLIIRVDSMILPNVDSKTASIGNPIEMKHIDIALEKGLEVFFTITDSSFSKLHNFGVAAVISNCYKVEDNTKFKNGLGFYYNITFDTLDIVKLDDLEMKQDTLFAFIDEVDVEYIASPEYENRYRTLIYNEFKSGQFDYFNYFSLPTIISDLYEDTEHLLEFIHILTLCIRPYDFTINSRILSGDSVTEKAEHMLQYIEQCKMIKDIDKKVNKKFNEMVAEDNRKYAISKKISILREELGETTNIQKEVEKFKIMVENEKNMAEPFKKAVLEQIEKLSLLNQYDVEASRLRTIIDNMLKLSWSSTKESYDLKKVRKTLDTTHHGMEDVKDAIVENVAIAKRTKQPSHTVLCLVGPPGVGKTSIAISVAEALNRPIVKQSLGGVSDEHHIRGHIRTYLGSNPGIIIKGMQNAKCNNPVFVLDEIDKLGTGKHYGDPSAALLEVLDPSQNTMYRDSYIEEEYDLSKVMFICTANYIEQIPEALKDRIEFIHLDAYSKFDKIEIAKKHIINQKMKEFKIKPSEFELSEEVLELLIEEYTREAGVRGLRKYIIKILRKAVLELHNSKKKIVVTKDNLKDFIKDKPLRDKGNEITEPKVGLVNGAAYLSSGGGVVTPIECIHYPGTGKVTVTPSSEKHASMVNDSLKLITTMLKVNRDALKISKDIDFDKIDIHINFSSSYSIGSVDGPSAGNAIALALLSSLTKRKIKPDFAITGALDLRGNAREIGGVKQKAIGTFNAKVSTFYIPYENERDIVDIPDVVKNELDIKTYKTFNEIVDLLLLEEEGTPL